MNPDDNKNTPMPNDEGMPGDNNQTPMQPATVGGPEKKKKMWFVCILIVLLVLLLLFLGWWWWKDKDKKDEAASSASSSQEQQAEAVTCDEGFTEYENAELGLGFCYPTAWGEVTVADAKFEAADTGERWTVKFADKSFVNLGVVTPDWSTEVARDGTCVDPAVQTLPAFSPFSTTWETEGTPVTSATRGIEVSAGEYLIQEYVDDLLTNGVCIEGYTIIEGDTYTHTAASYFAEFVPSIATPQEHIDSPNTLVTEAERNEFYTFVKSVHAL